MCASYGLGGGPYTPEGRYGLDPMDERENQTLINEWMRKRNGKASITGREAVNLNPIIMDGGDRRVIEFAWWWLWPNRSGPAPFDAFNAKIERLHESRAWRPAFQHRAILPATWFIEQKKAFGLPDIEVFGIAAITNTVILIDGTELTTYTMVTREALGDAAKTHPRMPLALPATMHEEWLDPKLPGDEKLVSKAQSASEEISQRMHALGHTPDATEQTLF